MKRNCINKIAYLGWLLLLVVIVSACNSGEKDKSTVHAGHKQEVTQYTCPMHPEIVRDKPGQCPICGMDLVPKTAGNSTIGLDSSLSHLLKPVNEQVVSALPVIVPEKGNRIYTAPVQGVITYDTRNNTGIASRVSGRIEKLYLKYNYQPVVKGQLILELYSPDLAAAQRELIYLIKSNAAAELIQSARLRLQLLGMSSPLIEKAIAKGEPLYRIPVYSPASGYILEITAQNSVPQATVPSTTGAAGGDGMGSMGSGASAPSTPAMGTPANTPVLLREGQYVTAGQNLFTIYNNKSLVAEFAFPASLAAVAQKGKQILYYPGNNAGKTYTGKIGLVQPVFRSGQNFTLVRVYTPDADFRVGQLLSADIAVATNDHFWLPQEAVLDLGNRNVVFKKESNVFVPKTVKTGIRAKGFIEILDNIENWQLASNAYYLVDSDSFIPDSQSN
jgi:membrane fusion protein, copper/silver efflux system